MGHCAAEREKLGDTASVRDDLIFALGPPSFLALLCTKLHHCAQDLHEKLHIFCKRKTRRKQDNLIISDTHFKLQTHYKFTLVECCT